MPGAVSARKVAERTAVLSNVSGGSPSPVSPAVRFPARLMSDNESVRDACTCLGGFLGMFLGATLGFAVCMKLVVDKVARNDGTVDPNQALLPFLGVLAAGCVGAVAGAVLIRLVFAGYTMMFSSSGGKR